MSERIATDVVVDILANVATEPPWCVIDDGNVRHVAARFGAMIAEDVGDDAPLLAAAPDLAADLLDARAAVAEERARREAAEAEVARLRAVCREAAQVLIAEVGAPGPMSVLDAALRAAGRVSALTIDCDSLRADNDRLRPIEAAARAHVAELAALVAAEAAHAGPQPTPAGRHGAMAAVLLRRRGVVGSVAALAGAVGR